MDESIRLLTATKSVPDKRFFDRAEFIRRIWESAPREASGYLSAVGTLKDLPVLDALGTAASAEAKIGILARIKPDEAFSYVLDSRVFPSPPTLEKLRIGSSALSDQTLLAALRSSNSSIRVIAFRELERRGDMTHAHATEGLRDVSAVIRQIALEWLIEKGEQIDPKQIRDLLGNQTANLWPFFPDSIDSGRTISLSIMRLSREDLEKFSTWSSLDGPIAYRILAENHFSAMGEVVRQDLRTNFARLKEDWIAEWQSLVGSAEAEKHIAEMSKYDDLIRAQFAAAALSGLARNGTSADRSLVIPFLKSNYSFAALAAVRALRNIGLPEDSGTLLDTALSDGGQLRETAASAAVYLSPGVNGPAADLLASNDPQLITLALVSLEPERLRDISERLEGLLLHSHDAIRTCALAFLVKKGTRKYLLALLDRYLQNENYFYNVVCHLDRVLYAPEPLRGYFKEGLTAVLNTKASTGPK